MQVTFCDDCGHRISAKNHYGCYSCDMMAICHECHKLHPRVPHDKRPKATKYHGFEEA